MNFIVLLFSLPIKIAVTWLLWDFVVGSQSELMGLSKSQILLFVAFSAFLQFLYNTSEVLMKMEQDLIQGGAVVSFTLPIDYHIKEIFEGWGNFLLYFSTGILTLLGMILLMGIPVPISITKILLLLVLIILNTILQYLFVSVLAAFAVLVGKVGAFGHSLLNMLLFFGGGVLPLALFPAVIRGVLLFNPLSSMIDFPASVLISGELQVAEVVYRLAVLVGWIVVLFFSNRRIWEVSRDRFSAPGE